MRERDQMQSDKAKQGLSGLRIDSNAVPRARFREGIGKVPSGGSVASIIYGSDARLSDMVKAARGVVLSLLVRVVCAIGESCDRRGHLTSRGGECSCVQTRHKPPVLSMKMNVRV